MTILEEIIFSKHQEVAAAKERVPVKLLEKSPGFNRKPHSLSASILDSAKTGIIAEFKRKSPSKGIINHQSSVEEVTTGYYRAGASGLSILTDGPYFGGALADLERARQLVNLPILRKDFILDEYQVIESKAGGADAILLIAAALDASGIKNLSRLARSLGLEVLFEVHRAEELELACDEIDLVGVNNRNLDTFEVNIELSEQLVSKIPSQFIRISESGISSTLAIQKLRKIGYQGFLIGERFMKMREPAAAFSDFVKQLMDEDDQS
jgi:indole-3-glycerol phosphate synthase